MSPPIILTVALGVLYPVYLSAAIFGLQYIGWVVVQLLIPVLYISGSIILWQATDKTRDEYLTAFLRTGTE